jgi:hypothetical protein
MSTHGRAKVPQVAGRPSGAGGRRWPGRGLVRGAYCVEAGITATAAGAWASSEFSGSLRAVVWIGVTTALAAIATWLAEPAVTALGHCAAGNRR